MDGLVDWSVVCGDALQLLREVPDNSVDSLVTDPPAGIEFMGRDWDTFKEGRRSKGWACCNKTGGDGFGGFGKTLRPAFHTQGRGARESFVAAMTEIFVECNRVLKPGAHALVWSIPRTSHWTAWALEEAGFHIHDRISHVYGQGMPKSKNMGDGFGTALKPAHEDWILARTPVKGSITANYHAIGTGAMNIDACRVDRAADDVPGWHQSGSYGRTEGYLGESTFKIRDMSPEEVQARCGDKGRWPPNMLLSGEAIAEMDRQSGHTKGSGKSGMIDYSQPDIRGNNFNRAEGRQTRQGMAYGDSGGASRYFPCFGYFPKPGRAEKEAGLDAFADATLNRVNPGGLEREERFAPVQVKNNHPTVKGIELMRWLCRLVTPPGGIVLDPFCGSGSTGCAAVLEGFRFLGFEQDASFASKAEARIAHWEKQR